MYKLLSYVVHPIPTTSRHINMWAGVGYSTSEEIEPIKNKVLHGISHAELETMCWTEGQKAVESAVSDALRNDDVELVPHYHSVDQSLYVMLLLSRVSIAKYLRLRRTVLRELQRAFPNRRVRFRRVIDLKVALWALLLASSLLASAYVSAPGGASSVFSVCGLMLDIIGVLLLYLYGLSTNHSKQSALGIGGGGYDYCQRRQHAILSRSGLAIVVLGFMLQALAWTPWLDAVFPLQR